MSLVGLSIRGRRAWLHIDNHLGVLVGDFEAGAEAVAVGELNGEKKRRKLTTEARRRGERPLEGVGSPDTR